MSEAIGYILSCYPPGYAVSNDWLVMLPFTFCRLFDILIVIEGLALLAIMLWVFKAWLSGNLIARRAPAPPAGVAGAAKDKKGGTR